MLVAPLRRALPLQPCPPTANPWTAPKTLCARLADYGQLANRPEVRLHFRWHQDGQVSFTARTAVDALAVDMALLEGTLYHRRSFAPVRQWTPGQHPHS